MAEKKNVRVQTPIFTASYPHVFTPKLNKLNGKMEYSVVALFPLDADLSLLYKAVDEVCVATWGPDKKKWPRNLKLPFKKQGEMKPDASGNLPQGAVDGAIYMNIKCDAEKKEYTPQVVDKNVQPILEQREFYAGCKARCMVTFFAYDLTASKGVSCSLGNIQKVGEGKPLGVSRRPEDEFKAIEGDESEDLEFMN